MKTCCVRTNKREQASISMLKLDLADANSKSESSNKQLITKLHDFSCQIEANLDWKHGRVTPDGKPIPPIGLKFSEDAGLLQCQVPISNEEDRKYTMFGIYENQSLFSSRGRDVLSEGLVPDTELKVSVEAYKASSDFDTDKGCHCIHPNFDWTRKDGKSEVPIEAESLPFDARIKVVDLTTLQHGRRESCKPENDEYMTLDSPAGICHLLRSTLKCGDESQPSKYGCHCASPWRNNCRNCEIKEEDTSPSEITVECDDVDQVVVIVLCNQINERNTLSVSNKSISKSSKYWDELEKKEIQEFIKFRTNDAAPNFYLYSVSEMKSFFSVNGGKHPCEPMSTKGYTMLVYRHIPKRPQFQTTLIKANEKKDTFKGCLWEQCRVRKSVDGQNEGESIANKDEISNRMVISPYQEVDDLYGDLLQPFQLVENIKIMTEEARMIPQWTAWPEKNHYQSDYDDSDEKNTMYPASWTVFPLCHTFPSTDVSKRQFIPLTCGFVPKTTELLKSLGPYLRTALFSRLEPRTTLGVHTGWSDLANHVLRVHIPLIIPSKNGQEGLCGTWVDGCVESHADGRIICFDDSKTHRAFNYSDDDRIVLIIDLARPEEDFPIGTATGGHTDELDKFIKQFAA